MQATELVPLNKDHKQVTNRNNYPHEEEKKIYQDERRENATGDIKEKKDISEKKDGLENVIKCAKCELLMSYPAGSYFITCPTCLFVTPTVEMLTLNCQFCKLLSYFPKNSITVQCRCGAVYAVS